MSKCKKIYEGNIEMLFVTLKILTFELWISEHAMVIWIKMPPLACIFECLTLLELNQEVANCWRNCVSGSGLRGFKCPSQSQCHSHPAVYGSRNRTVRYFSSTTSAYLPLCFPLWWEWTKPLNLYANLNKIPSVYKSHVYDCLFITIEHWPVQKQDAIHKAQLIFL